jgi:hypothetical protein
MRDRSKAEPAGSRSALAISFLAASLTVTGCSSTIGFDDPFADYLQRTPLVSTTGGDSQAANTAMQTATPWPRYANDTNIPANGARTTAVIKRYESGSSGESASGGAQTSTGSGANPGGSTNGGASAGMNTSPSSQPSGY